MSKSQDALLAVALERARHSTLIAQGKFIDYFLPGVSDTARLTILTEELGEAAKETCEILHSESKEWPNEDREMVKVHKERVKKRLKGLLRKELIQVAAVAIAWIESLDMELGDK